ncbi:exocyst complex component EXO70A1-like [Cornus florida]|uniref:exocyst complex component EXO70A1-like n=1 Tax=Cornus florida TaxID=4283 RepID=UPI0028A0DEAF|nr:exocyst complex component EXO70A1-like [Cornus florida]
MEKKDDLHRIAEILNSAGHLEKCVDAYQSVRKTFLETSLRKLGIQRLSMNDIRSLEWEALENKIRQWTQAAKICVSVLFASEERLCKRVFGGLGNAIDDDCFAETVKDPAFQLFEAGKALSICTSDRSRRPEKLFRILDLHEMLLKLLKDVEIIFRSESLESVGIQATEMLWQLAKAAREILPQFESDMLRAQSHFQDQSGGIDNLTTYVVRFITQIAYYNEGLTKLIVSKPEFGRNCGDAVTIPDAKLAQLDGRTSTTPLVVHLIWIVEILQFKLEAKSKRYDNPSLAQLFMMNNVHYIVQNIKEDPDLRDMVGDDYLKTLIENVQLLMNAYMGSTWERLVYCLRDEGLYASPGPSLKVSKSALRERFKSFNATLEEIYQNQAKWVVPNQQIRNKLRHSISEKLITAYSSFLERFRSHLGKENQQEKYIKHTVEDLSLWSELGGSDGISPPTSPQSLVVLGSEGGVLLRLDKMNQTRMEATERSAVSLSMEGSALDDSGRDGCDRLTAATYEDENGSGLAVVLGEIKRQWVCDTAPAGKEKLGCG